MELRSLRKALEIFHSLFFENVTQQPFKEMNSLSDFFLGFFQKKEQKNKVSSRKYRKKQAIHFLQNRSMFPTAGVSKG